MSHVRSHLTRTYVALPVEVEMMLVPTYERLSDARPSERAIWIAEVHRWLRVEPNEDEKAQGENPHFPEYPPGQHGRYKMSVTGAGVELWIAKSRALTFVPAGDYIAREADSTGFYPVEAEVVARKYERRS